jgi:hypothetical protein
MEVFCSIDTRIVVDSCFEKSDAVAEPADSAVRGGEVVPAGEAIGMV